MGKLAGRSGCTVARRARWRRASTPTPRATSAVGTSIGGASRRWSRAIHGADGGVACAIDGTIAVGAERACIVITRPPEARDCAVREARCARARASCTPGRRGRRNRTSEREARAIGVLDTRRALIWRHRRRREPLSRDLESRGRVTRGMKSVVANLDEARRQHVLDEAREQLVSGDGDGVAVLGAEGDAALVDRDEALIGDADAVGVSAEITNHLLGSAEGTLGVDDPRFASERADVDASEVNLPTCVSALERGDHLAAKERAHDTHREEEVLACAHPARRRRRRRVRRR